ncbi:MAG: LPS assembly protein LptD [Maricaulaceae bacterium]|jgi:LPS-assembly protein
MTGLTTRKVIGVRRKGAMKALIRRARDLALVLAAAGIPALSAFGPAAAQTTWQVGADPAEQAVAETEGLVYLEADTVELDDATGRYIARGNVVITYQQRTLYADEVIVFPEQDRVLASGNLRVVDATGVVTHAESAEFSQDLNSGVLEAPVALMPGSGTAGAALAVRSGGSVNELRRAFYTVCEVCAEEGEQARPTWRLRARRVTQDEDAQMLYYRDAMLEIKGVPVLYTPFFAHADPSSERRSGFLLPYFGESSRTGAFYEQPYYWAISPSQDVTISPRLMSSANPIVAFEHRKKFFSGGSLIQGSLTYEAEFDNDGNTFGEQTWRAHLFTDAEFEMTPNWNWGLAVERVSDDLYFRRYEIDDAEADRGLYRRNSKRLLSQLYIEGVSDDYYGSLAGLSYQGLRAGDDEDLFPIVLPFGRYERTLSNNLLGGRLTGGASVAVLERAEADDSRRFSLEFDWRRQFIAPGGIVAEPFGQLRGDVYSVSDFVTPDNQAIDEEVFSRGLGYVGAQVSWPVGRSAGAFDLIVEPVAQFVYSPTGGNDPRIPNNDSLITELDEANIFEPNRSPGYDVWEDGTQSVFGARATARWGTQSEAALFIGQAYRSQDAYEFPQASGLSGSTSDVVGAASFQLDPRRRVSARFRLDHSTLDLSKLDLDAAYALGRASVSTKYLRFADDIAVTGPREELSMTAGVEFTNHLGAYYRTTLDLSADETRFAFFGLVYDDECSRFELIYKFDGTQDRALDEGDSIRLQFTLTSLGTFGQRD